MKLLQAACRKMPQATYLLWYPIVDMARVEKLERDLARAALPELHQFELGIREHAAESGMSGSGVMVVNPPWTLKAKADVILPQLSAVLAEDGIVRFRSNRLG